MDNNKLKHLEFIQNVITRMATNSFLIKGWLITILAALFVLSQKDTNIVYLLMGILPIPFFWGLDGYYLWQERLFRHLYDKVRLLKEGDIDFDMKTKIYQNEFGGEERMLDAVFSKTLNLFYIPLYLILFGIIAIVSNQ